MSGLKQLRNRVKSIKSTQKITKAMHVVSAAKLKKVKDKAENANQYSSVLSEVMLDVSTSGNLMDLPLCDRRFFNKDLMKLPHLLVVMTSERGLCGGFNSSIAKKVKKDIEQIQSEGKEAKLLIIGKKGYDALKGKYSNIIEQYYHGSKGDIEALSIEAKNKIISMIEEGKSGPCRLYYNEFKNAMMQIPVMDKILPIQDIQGSHKNNISEYEYEGDGLVHQVINLYVSGLIHYGLLQSRASEEGARMTAMDNANRNAGEMIDKLTLQLNRSRQAIITTELTEIISGAEAV